VFLFNFHLLGWKRIEFTRIRIRISQIFSNIYFSIFLPFPSLAVRSGGGESRGRRPHAEPWRRRKPVTGQRRPMHGGPRGRARPSVARARRMGVARCGSRHDDADARRATNRPSTRPGRAGRRRTASCCCFSRALRRACRGDKCVCVWRPRAMPRWWGRDVASAHVPRFLGLSIAGALPQPMVPRRHGGPREQSRRARGVCTARRGSCSSALSWAGCMHVHRSKLPRRSMEPLCGGSSNSAALQYARAKQPQRGAKKDP